MGPIPRPPVVTFAASHTSRTRRNDPCRGPSYEGTRTPEGRDARGDPVEADREVSLWQGVRFGSRTRMPSLRSLPATALAAYTTLAPQPSSACRAPFAESRTFMGEVVPGMGDADVVARVRVWRFDPAPEGWNDIYGAVVAGVVEPITGTSPGERLRIVHAANSSCGGGDPTLFRRYAIAGGRVGDVVYADWRRVWSERGMGLEPRPILGP